ncbi:unnamed protein product, partial [marine sediment metagenome]
HNDMEEGGLAAAVWPYQTYAIAAMEVKTQMVKHEFVFGVGK